MKVWKVLLGLTVWLVLSVPVGIVVGKVLKASQAGLARPVPPVPPAPPARQAHGDPRVHRDPPRANQAPRVLPDRPGLRGHRER